MNRPYILRLPTGVEKPSNMSLCCRTTISGHQRLLSRPPIVVRCTGSVDSDMVARFTRDFGRAVASGQKFIPVVVSSDGGELVSAIEIVAAIKTSPVPVATIVNSEALSAAALIFSAGSRGMRFVGPYATIMIHQVALAGICGNAKTVALESRELQRANDDACRLMSENAGKGATFFADMLRKADGDVYFNPGQAVEVGLASCVGTPHIETHIDVQLKLVAPPRWSVGARVLDVGPSTGGGTRHETQTCFRCARRRQRRRQRRRRE